MEYSSFVRSHSEEFARSLKLAEDLATLLDCEILSAANITVQKFDVIGLAIVRLEVFDDLGALCFRHGIPVPELEPEILELCRPKTESKKDSGGIRRLVKIARQSVGGKKPKADAKRDLLAIMRCLELMPGLAGREEDLCCFKAMANALLLQLGLPTLRPDFAAVKVPNSMGCPFAPRPLKVLIVDDDIREIVRTLRNLAGWPGLQFDVLRFWPDCDRWSCTADQQAEIVSTAVKDMLSRKPDIIVMDEGLPVTDGGELIKAVKAAKPEFQIEFVGSTGGDGHQLREAGAILNLSKGRDPGPLIQAIRRFGRG